MWRSCEGIPGTFLSRHPTGTDVVLAVEISVTSQRLDREKAAVYARAGVAAYWNVDVPARQVRVHTDPAGGEYRHIRVLREDEALPIDGLSVRDLLP